MKGFRGIFPGVFTMGNLFCGFLSVLSSFDGEARHAAWFILLAAFFDGLDGIVARLSKGTTRFGVELDSLADLVSFGVAPAVVLYSFKLSDLGKWGWILGFVFVMCGAFRLARFNLQAKAEGKDHFVGLPVPAAGTAIAAYTLFCYELWGQLRFPEFLVTMIVAFSGLMVSTVVYEAKPRSLRTVKDKIKFAYLLLGTVAVVLKPRLALFPLFAFYVLYGIFREIYDTVASGLNGRPKPAIPPSVLAEKQKRNRLSSLPPWPGEFKEHK